MKLLKIVLFLLFILIVIGIVALPTLIKSWATADSFARHIEAELNCRASIDEVKVALFRQPSIITLRGLALGPRDEYATSETPLGERPPMNEMVSHCESIQLEMRLGSLLTRQLNVQQFIVSNLNIQLALREDGSNSLEELFRSPGSDANENAKQGNAGKEGGAGDAEGDGKPFNARDLPVSMIADRLAIEGGSVYATVEATGATILIDEIDVAATDIDIAPLDLERHNRALLELSMLVGVDSPPEKGERYAEFQFIGNAVVTPFAALTGDLEPGLIADLVIAEDSFIDANPTLEAVGKLLKDLEQYGIDVGDVDLRGDFKEPVETRLEWAKEVLTVLIETKFNVGDYSLVLAPESWLDANTNQHDFQGVVVASEERTMEAIEDVDEWLESKISALANPTVRNTLLAPVMKDGRIQLGFRSSGGMDAPKVDLVTGLGSVSDILSLKDSKSLDRLKRQGKQLLEGLKGFFKCEPESVVDGPTESPTEPELPASPKSEPIAP